MKNPVFAPSAALFLTITSGQAAFAEEIRITSTSEEAKPDLNSIGCENKWDILRAKNPVGLKLTYRTSYRTERDGPVRFDTFYERTVASSTDKEISYLALGASPWFGTVYTYETFLADCKQNSVSQSITIEADNKTTNIIPGLQSFVPAGTFDSLLLIETLRRDQGFSSTSTLIAQDGSDWTLKTVHETLNYSPEPDLISETELIKIEYP